MRIFKDIHFESAHFLPLVPDGHRCRYLHGHNYRARIEVSGDLLQEGWVCDFADIDAACKPVLAALDHRLINDTIQNPTAENIAQWILDALSGIRASQVTVWETAECGAIAGLDKPKRAKAK